ncbi:MAG: glycosyltransferase family 4 protein [Candidatus Methanoperedens sp.]|nr:glycosyltransferase family 4 protein [Candidatus Methanoperedens sp.]
MRILFVPSGSLKSINTFEHGGAESQIYGISKEIIKKGHEVYVTGLFDGFKDNESIAIVDGIQFINIGTPHLKDKSGHHIMSTIGTLLYSKAVTKKIKQINPDVISLNERFSAYFSSNLNIPKTFTTHNPDGMAFYKDFAIESNRLNYVFFDVKRRIEEKVMSRSDTIIALTNSIRDYLQECGFTNTCIIPNAVDAKKYTNRGDENFILFAGRLDKVKGIQYLIEAFSELINDFDSDLLIVGSGPDEMRLKKIVKSKNMADRVHFIPMVGKNELRGFLSKCSVFVLPSLFESFGIVMIEAMASGKPVIASDIPGPRDVIKHEYDGFLFKRENVGELKKYLYLCLSDEKLRRKIGTNGRKTIEGRYTFDKIANQYLKVYGNLLCFQQK